MRRDVLKRNYTNDQFRQAIKLARDHGMHYNIFNMIGVPGETPADHLETVALNREARPNFAYTGIFYPYPGTELYEVCKRRGLLEHRLEVH